MAGDQKERIYSITAPTSLAKLSGVQLSITSLEQMAMDIRKVLPEKHGVVSGCTVIANRVHAECVNINDQVKKELIDPSEAKIRVNQTLKIVDIIKEIGSENRNDLVAMECKANGHIEAANVLSKQYEDLAVKYERHERIDAEDAAEVKERAEENAEEALKAPKAKKRKSKGEK